MVNYEIKNGIILLAEPFMLDPNFRRATVLLCEHNPEGSIGFVINRPTEYRIDELLEDFPEFNSIVYQGGPVQIDTIHYLHNVGDLLEDCAKVSDGVYWGGDFEKLKFLINTGLITPENIRFYVGYSGWDEGQLMDEMAEGSWVTADMHPNYVFKTQADELWQQVMHNKGDVYSVIATMPDTANWN